MGFEPKRMAITGAMPSYVEHVFYGETNAGQGTCFVAFESYVFVTAESIEPIIHAYFSLWSCADRDTVIRPALKA